MAHYAPTTFTNKMTAERWLANERDLIERAAALGEPWISPRTRSFCHNHERNIGRLRQAMDRATKRQTAHAHSLLIVVEDHIAPELGKLPIDKVTSQLVRNWYAKTLTDKPTMHAHAYGLLSSICNTAIKDGLIERNPCQINGAMHAKTNRESRFWKLARSPH